MALHFQVYAKFTLSCGKMSLAHASIFSTRAACTLWPFCPNEKDPLTISRIFHTLKEAYSYAAYLHRLYHSRMTPPVLDGGQKDLFPEV